MSKNKIKEMITLEHRISLFQTSMNNSGRNFEGKKTTVKKMAVFAADLYRLAIKEIGDIGDLSLRQLESTFKRVPTQKVEIKSDLKKLMSKIKRKSKLVAKSKPKAKKGKARKK